VVQIPLDVEKDKETEQNTSHDTIKQQDQMSYLVSVDVVGQF